jgi:hypothetical protein
VPVVALANLAVNVTVIVTGRTESLRLSTLTVPLIGSIVAGSIPPLVWAVALTTWPAVQHPDTVTLEISWPGPGFVPLTCQAKMDDAVGGIGEIRVAV